MLTATRVTDRLLTLMKRPPEQLELKIAEIELPQKPSRRSSASSPVNLGPRLAVSPDEAAAVLGVSRDYFDEHIINELRIVRRGRRILVSLAELERWLDRASAMRGSIDRRRTLAKA